MLRFVLVSYLALGVRGLTREDGAFKTLLRNFADMQYTAEIKIADQPVQAILDTGSYDLIAFPATCDTCERARGFDPSTSLSHQDANATEHHAYGSGSCDSTGAYDDVELGAQTAKHQLIWEPSKCSMPVLARAAFQAIVGLGPPGWRASMLKKTLETLDPDSQFAKDTMAQLGEAEHRRDFIENMQSLHTFSICLGREPGSHGVVITNDDSHESSMILKAPITSEVSWTVDVSEFNLMGQQFVCSGGCKALVDTGSSLMAVPSDVYMALSRKVDALISTHGGCDDLTHFPDLDFQIGDKILKIPPQAYIGNMRNTLLASENLRTLLHLESVVGNMEGDEIDAEEEAAIGGNLYCQMLIMDMGVTAGAEYHAILGMPLLRQYLTTFHYGKKPSDRFISFSDPSEQCAPSAALAVSQVNSPKTMDLSMAFLPSHLHDKMLAKNQMPAGLVDAKQWSIGPQTLGPQNLDLHAPEYPFNK